jgi:RHS Repeat
MTRKDRIAILLAGAAIAAAPALAIAAETIAYRYDSLGRLIRVDRSGGVNNGIITNYSYDKADNRILKNSSGSPNSGPP